MQILDQNDVYYNFLNLLDSKYTYYKLCLEKFLSHYKLELTSFLKLHRMKCPTLSSNT